MFGRIAGQLALCMRGNVVSGRRARWIILAGGSAGLIIWVYDYDFFFNAGGPAAPISSAVLTALHLRGMAYPVPLLVPPMILVALGIATAAAGVGLYRLLVR